MLLITLGLCIWVCLSSAGEYPSPHIVLVGPTGAGKSSLANALLGCDPRTNECMFGTCSGFDSCTKNTTIGSGQWLGDNDGFTIVDTPGFGDSDGSDNKLIEEMMDILNNELHDTNIIVLTIDGATPRFTSGLYDMLRQMTSIFGETWWDFMMIGVSKWHYDQNHIDGRNDDCEYFGDPSENCKNEAWFMRELSLQLEEKFDVQRELTFAFMDSYSQSGPNLDDQIQQLHWIEETNKLWSEVTQRNETFDFKTIDEVLEENAACQEENENLLETVNSMNETIHSLLEQIFDLNQTNSIMREQIADLQQENEDLQNQVIDLNEQIDKLRAQRDDLVEQNANLEAQLAIIQNQNEILQRENDALEIQVEELQSENANLSSRNLELELENGILKSENDQLKEENDNLNAEINQLRKQNTDLTAENAVLKKENDDLKRKLSEFTSSKIVGLHILTGDNGCDYCSMHVTIHGPSGSCDTGELDNSADNWEDNSGDMFIGSEIGGCSGRNLGNADSSRWYITLYHEGSGGWEAKTAWIMLDSGASLKCNINGELDNTEHYDYNCYL